MGGRGGYTVGAVLVAPGTSSSVGRVLGNRDVEGRRNYLVGTRYSFFVFKNNTEKSRTAAYGVLGIYVHRCSLVFSASSAASAFLLLLLVLLLLLLLASAAATSAAAAAGGGGAATALRTAGWSCSVFSSLFFQLSRESYMVMDIVVQNPLNSSGYGQGATMRKNM